MQEPLEQTRRRRWGQQMRPIGKGNDLLWRTGKGSGDVSGGTIRGAYREGGTIRLWRIRAHFQGILPVPLVGMTLAAQLDAITIVCLFLQRTTNANQNELPSKASPISRFFQADFVPPDEATAGYDERDSWIARVGSCDEEVCRGRGKWVDKLEVPCLWE
jgi:hypothetical protein